MTRLRPFLVVGLLALLAWPAAAQNLASIGNLNEPVPPSLAGLLTGDQSFAYLVFPQEQVSCPERGFRLEFVNMYLDFQADQVPQVLKMSSGLVDAVWDEQQQAWVPGQSACAAQQFELLITEPGLQVVSCPVQGSCGCQTVEQPYFLNLSFLGAAAANLVTDGQPQPGIVYWDQGNGWTDMYGVDKTATGKTIIWGDIVCCAYSVGNENRTWSGVKSLYR
ncbi:MAG TPA: hypothetical protein PLH84_15265 [Candidatus Krumholzibacteria bacterium]|nr:hypothetical protein [Candidatus Krumholzibacteria bacterium]